MVCACGNWWLNQWVNGQLHVNAFACDWKVSGMDMTVLHRFCATWVDDDDYFYMWASALYIRFTVILPLLTDPQQFHYCTDSNPGTGADDAFVLKHGVRRNATWPSHSRPAIAASARHFQICFLPEYFDRLFVYLLFVYLVLFMHQAMSNIFWHLRMFI